VTHGPALYVDLLFFCLEAAANLSLLRGCHPITLLFAASNPFGNFENHQQDKATDTEPNKPNKGVRPTEQNISVRNIGVGPSFGAFDQVVPTGPPRHRLPPPLVTGNKAVMTEVGDSDKETRPRLLDDHRAQEPWAGDGGFQGAVAGLKFW
jgi:hypothetical protein